MSGDIPAPWRGMTPATPIEIDNLAALYGLIVQRSPDMIKLYRRDGTQLCNFYDNSPIERYLDAVKRHL